MFQNRKDLNPVLASFLNSIHQAASLALRDYKSSSLITVTVPVVNATVDNCWEEFWSDSTAKQMIDILGGMEKIESYKVEIFNDLISYAVGVTNSIESVIDSNDWVTSEMKSNRYYWKLCEAQMKSYLNDGNLAKVDEESELVLRRLHDPNDSNSWSTRGLVVGSVQSGKTANYSALISKAADAGYRLIIILSGIHNDLRSQTQERLDKEFIGYSQIYNKVTKVTDKKSVGVGTLASYQDERAPRSATTVDFDFGQPEVGVETLPWLFVVKKIPNILNKLASWLKNHVPNRHNWPLLLIDDEADQASVNTAKGQKKITETNKQIRRILRLFDRSSFVGYTATPFANIFINSTNEDKELGKDLFPKDFILRLEKSPNYFGPKDFFGNEFDSGLELYDYLDENTLQEWVEKVQKGTAEELPEEITREILQFVLSTALRLWRKNQRFNLTKPLDSSMLIHLSHKIVDQKHLSTLFKEEICYLRQFYLGRNCSRKIEIRNILCELFKNQKNKVTPSLKTLDRTGPLSMDWALPSDFEELDQYIHEVFECVELLMVNGESKQKKVLEAQTEKDMDERYVNPRIYIGGNKLSRGLTIPGLCVSLFLRTTSIYDTLLQMGRWFGYRDDYVDLCRISTTPTIVDRFRMICSACEDLDEQIDEMNAKDRTPENYRLSILKHPKMLITARNKMRDVDDAEVNFNAETSYHLNMGMVPAIIQKNNAAVQELINDINRLGRLVYSSANVANYEQPMPKEVGIQPEGRLWRDVPGSVIIKFLSKYQATTGGRDTHQQGVCNHIIQMQEKEELTHWNVFIPGEPDVNSRYGSKPVTRNQKNHAAVNSVLMVKSLKTGSHEYIGVPEEWYAEATKKAKGKNRTRFRHLREVAGERDPAQGFFHLYLIDAVFDGKAHSACSTGFVNDTFPVVSYYLWLPQSKNATSMNMKAFNKTVQDLSEDILEDDEDEE